MHLDQIIEQIKRKQSFLCVGLDPDLSRIPSYLGEDKDAVLNFLHEIIKSTSEFCVSYKLNSAFFECLGDDAFEVFHRVCEMVPKDCFLIADAKRADIGNTSKKYAECFLKEFACNAITIAPYMGSDSVKPFLDYEGKWVILLGLTSNKGSDDFQQLTLSNGNKLYEEVLWKSSQWASKDKMMYVIGATHPEEFKNVRRIVPNHFLLVPGVGAQGGDLEAVYHNGANEDIGLLINSSRAILYASEDQYYAEAAAEKAHSYQKQMKNLL